MFGMIYFKLEKKNTFKDLEYTKNKLILITIK